MLTENEFVGCNYPSEKIPFLKEVIFTNNKKHSKNRGVMLPLILVLFAVAAAAVVFILTRPGKGKVDSPSVPETSISESSAPSQSQQSSSAQSSSSSKNESSLQSSDSGQDKTIPQSDDWRLILVNPWNKLTDGYVPELTQLQNGHSVDSRAYADLQAMMDGCRAAGNNPVICSSYRTWETQTRLFNNQVNSLMKAGYSAAAAQTEAAKAVAPPGTSEHQLGLALDIVDVNNQNLDDSQENTPVQKWLMAHCTEYGFILRFPKNKSDITGIIYEPWHYRYVGREAAKAIAGQGICLEEYLAK